MRRRRPNPVRTAYPTSMRVTLRTALRAVIARRDEVIERCTSFAESTLQSHLRSLTPDDVSTVVDGEMLQDIREPIEEEAETIAELNMLIRRMRNTLHPFRTTMEWLEDASDSTLEELLDVTALHRWLGFWFPSYDAVAGTILEQAEQQAGRTR